MNDLDNLDDLTDELDEAAEEALAEQYKNGKHYDRAWFRANALKAGPGPNPLKVATVDLGVGDSAERLDSTKGQKLWGPQSVEVVFWPDGGIDQNLYDLGKAPKPPKNTYNGRYIDPTVEKGRKTGDYYDKQLFEWDGESKTAREWYEHPSRIEGLSRTTFTDRLKKQGMSVPEALTAPIQRGGRREPKNT
ncbi:hypothetical protein ACFYN0_26330 [Streptomyces sp. NPDC006704]|uniref:hypothetical protein n=1 Tax=Streptomyces sp. NPDC006704 TaxID=3364760 RepID=UPI0036C6539B